MAHQSQTDIALTPVSGGLQMRTRTRPVSRPTGSLFWDFFAFLFFKLSQRGILWGTLLYDRVLIPLAALGLMCVQMNKRVLYELRFLCHQAYVGICRLKANRITAAAFVASMVCISISASFYSFGFSLTMNGKTMGYVMDPAEFDRARFGVEQRMTTATGHAYGLHPNVVLSFGLVERDQLLSEQALQEALVSEISEVSDLYVLTVDGEVVGASYDANTLQTVLDKLKATPAPNGTVVSAKFNREVKIERKLTESKNLRSPEEIQARLAQNIHEKEYYIIQRGDTLASIAKKNGVSVTALKELNPGVSTESLVAGKAVLVNQALPFVSVQKTVRATEIKSVPYTTTQVDSANLYRGNTVVQSKGVNGTAQVTSEITYENGKELTRRQLAYTVLRAPVNQVIAAGSKPIPATNASAGSSFERLGLATGFFRRPVSGAIITSNYGYRGREFHTGVDFALAKGSAVVAADGGTVSFAGWKGDYGYLVIVNHGNGKQTYYGHNSKLLVHVGQRVAKGQQVAKMGSTGRSTGPHCHFEVRINGKHVNPWRYLS